MMPNDRRAPVVTEAHGVQEAGRMDFRTDRAPFKKEIAAALQEPEDDCVNMIGGGICEKHGLNAHLLAGKKDLIVQHGDGRTSVDFSRTDEGELEKRMQ